MSKTKNRDFIIGFSRSTVKFPIFSWLIRIYQGFTSYSHVYVKLLTFPKFPSNKILHAAEGQVCQYSETAFLKRNFITDEFTLTVCEETYKILVRDIFHEKSGELYSYLQNVGILYVRIMEKLGYSVKNPWVNGWNCSEYVLKVIQLIFPGEYDNKNPNTITPKEVYNILNKLRSEGRIK